MKGCAVEEKDETMDDRGCRKFVVDHIHDCEKVLRKLEDVHLTLSREKSALGKKKYWWSDIYVGPTAGDRHQQRSMRFKLWMKYASHNPKSKGFSVHVHSITYGLHTMHI